MNRAEVSSCTSAIENLAVRQLSFDRIYPIPPFSPTVVDGLQERFGACNGRALRGLDAHVARMTRPSDTQKEEAVFLQDKRKAVEFRQQRGEPS